MKIPNLCLFLFLFSYSGFSQDLIVTIGGDSINCKIHKIGEERIFFLDNRPGINKNASLSVRYIKLFKYNFYGSPYTLPYQPNNPYQPPKIPDYPNFQIKLFGGISRLNEKTDNSIPPEFYNYLEELKTGFHLGASAGHFLNEKTVIGFRSSLFFSSNSMDSIWIQPQGQPRVYGKLSDKITIFYLGPELNLILNRDDFKYLKFHFDFSFGFISYNNIGEFIIPLTEEGYGIGFSGEFGIDYFLNNKIALGFFVVYLPVRINSAYISIMGQRQQIPLDSEAKNDLSRFDFGVCIKILR